MSDVVEWEEVGTSELSPSVERQRKEVLTEAVENPPDYTIHLEEDGAILTPLKIPDYSELESGKTKNSDRICFLIENRKDEVSTISIEVFDGEKLVYSEQDVDKYRPHGVHKWYWNGADNAGVIDTKVLKSKSLKVKLVAKNKKAEQVLNLPLKNESSEVDWVDVVVDPGLQLIITVIRPHFTDGGVRGLGTVLTTRDARTAKTISPTHKSFAVLSQMAIDGIKRYWSRDGSRSFKDAVVNNPLFIGDAVYNINVRVDANSEPMADDFSLIDELRPVFVRSSSFGIRRIVRNIGDLMSDGWSESDVDEEFMMTAAHELGHFILNAYGGVWYSWTHKGTSYIWQAAKSSSKVPVVGEIDVMHYFSEEDQKKYYANEFWGRSVAAGDDVKGLIWLSRVKFYE